MTFARKQHPNPPHFTCIAVDGRGTHGSQGVYDLLAVRHALVEALNYNLARRSSLDESLQQYLNIFGGDMPMVNLMRRVRSLAIPTIAGTLMLAACSAPLPRHDASTNEMNKETVLAFYDAGLNRKDFDAASQYFGPYYRQHNPHAADGIEGFRKFVATLKEKTPTSHSEIVSAFADGNFVILHVLKKFNPDDRGTAIIDIFRLESGKIVEHWDVSQEIPEHTTSGNSMF